MSSISNSRWATYAAAGAATALTCANSAEAEIHYSGIVNHAFRGNSAATFPLDQSAKLQLEHLNIVMGGAAFGDIEGGIGGYYGGWGFVAASNYVSNLARGLNLSDLRFYAKCDASSSGTGCYFETIGFAGEPNVKFKDPGVGFIGFRFDRGAGYQYGWARIKTTGEPLYRFILEDYAWADPGESLQTGQKHSLTKAKSVPTSGSLGLIALGGAGLMAWRKRRSHPKP
jgi:hypothetical protein